MSEKQSYRDADDMPTERAVLEREWKAMRLALSTPRAALAAQPGVVPSNLVRAMLHNAMDRMDRARNLLTDGNPRPDCNWGMLDASDLRKALAAAPTEAKPAQDAVDARPLTTRELAELTAPWANVWTDASFGIANAAIEKFCEVNGIQRRLT